MWKRLIPIIRYQFRPSLVRYNITTTQPSLSYVQRIRKYFNDNPYLVVSFGFVGIVLVFGLIVDSITRKKKVTANLYQCLPPRPCHPMVPLYSTSTLLDNNHVLLTGPQGCGKTTLAFRTSQQFLQQWSLWSRKEPRTFYINASSRESLVTTFRECLLSYGITDDDIVPKGKLFHQLALGEQLQMMTSSLQVKLTSSKSRWLLIVDNITEETLSLCTSLTASFHDGRILAISHDPLLVPTLIQSMPSLHHVDITR